MEERNLLEFLHELLRLTQANIDFINGKSVHHWVLNYKYQQETKQIQNLINDFDFVEKQADCDE